MVTLKDIDKTIRNLIGEHPEASRPFLCKGSPIGCEVFLIGHNPAVSTFFWDCWDDQYGCDKEKWIQLFRQECSIPGKKMPGKKTRLNIERLIKEIDQYRVLDTNIYHKRSPNLPNLPRNERKTEVCDYLIENIVPKLIFVHGAEAIKRLAKLAKLPNEDLKILDFTPVYLFGNKTWIYAGFHHLCMKWKHERIQEVGQELFKWCEKNNLSLSK